MTRGIRFHLGAVQTDGTQLQELVLQLMQTQPLAIAYLLQVRVLQLNGNLAATDVFRCIRIVAFICLCVSALQPTPPNHGFLFETNPHTVCVRDRLKYCTVSIVFVRCKIL